MERLSDVDRLKDLGRTKAEEEAYKRKLQRKIRLVTEGAVSKLRRELGKKYQVVLSDSGVKQSYIHIKIPKEEFYVVVLTADDYRFRVDDEKEEVECKLVQMDQHSALNVKFPKRQKLVDLIIKGYLYDKKLTENIKTMVLSRLSV